jgi:hypothetical protein
LRVTISSPADPTFPLGLPASGAAYFDENFTGLTMYPGLMEILDPPQISSLIFYK